MSNEDYDFDAEFNKETDVLPDPPMPAGHYEGIVAGVLREAPDDSRSENFYPKQPIVRITYRVNAEGTEYNGNRVQSFPMPMRDHKDSWKWFKWCEAMGYDTSKPFRFNPDDVEGVPVNLEFGPPRVGKVGSKSEGKSFTNLISVKRLAI